MTKFEVGDVVEGSWPEAHRDVGHSHRGIVVGREETRPKALRWLPGWVVHPAWIVIRWLGKAHIEYYTEDNKGLRKLS